MILIKIKRELTIKQSHVMHTLLILLYGNMLQFYLLSKYINDVDNEFLTKEVTDEEIVEALKQINPLKTSGLDGIQAIFYHKNWIIVGTSVYNMVRSFFKSDHMLE